MDAALDAAGDADVDAAADGGGDAASDAAVDAGADASADAGSDAGTPSITIDGTVTDAEWAGATVARNTMATDWGAGLNHLDALRVAVVGDQLYLAIEGAMEPTNAMVAFVDAQLGTSAGVFDISTLSDTTGSLDNAVSATLVAPATFRTDYAFGTRAMGRSAVASDDQLGWRDVASNPADFAWISGLETPSVCSATACETRIPLATLGAVSGASVGVFVRLGNAMGNDFSNQTLPEDAPATPMTVSRWLEVAVP